MRLNSQYENKFFENRRTRVNDKLQKSIRNASIGLKVHGAADNAAGLAISETNRAQIRGLGQSQRNIQDGLGLLKTMEDGLMKVNEDVQRIYELSVMASNDTNDNETKEGIQVELEQLLSSINQTAKDVQFNTQHLLGPLNLSNNITLKTGSNNNESINIKLLDLSFPKLGLGDASVSTRDNAVKLIENSQIAIKNLTNALTRVGAQYSSLEHHLENSYVLQKNLTTLEANILDADMGKELMEVTIEKILTEANHYLHTHTFNQKQNLEKLLFQ